MRRRRTGSTLSLGCHRARPVGFTAGGLGWLRRRGAGLRAARAVRHRLALCTGAQLDRRIMVRLVKGAYWDTEIKRAQVLGLARLSRVHAQGRTPTSPISPARKQLLGLTDRIYPQFADPQRPHRRGHSGDGEETGQARLASNSSACTAWARRCTRRCRQKRRHALPHLCAGRRAFGSARLSGAPPAGERRQLVLRASDRR